MKPNKLEQQFRELLQNRTIEPSDKAWDRLDAMLSVAEKKKKPIRTWWFVAASLLILLSIGTFFFKAEKFSPTFHKDRKSTRLNSSHVRISYAVFCLKK